MKNVIRKGVVTACFGVMAACADAGQDGSGIEWTETEGPTEQGDLQEQQQASVAVTCKPSVSASPNPSTLGGSVTLTSALAGCSTSGYEFSYMYKAPGGTTYIPIVKYPGESSVSWNTTGLPSGKYSVIMRARQPGATVAYEYQASTGVTIGNVCTGIALTLASPYAAVSAPVDFSVDATCTGGTPEYKLVVSGTSSGTSNWFPSSTAQFSLPFPPGPYKVTAYARVAGNSTGDSYFEAVSAPRALDLGDRCTSPVLSISPSSPAPAGSTVTLSSTATCTGSTAEFRYSYYDNTTMKYVPLNGGAWTTTPFEWNTTGVPLGNTAIYVETRANDGPHPTQGKTTQKYAIGAICSGATLTTSASTVPFDSDLALTASSSCTSGTAEYRFLQTWPGATSAEVVCDWSTESTCLLNTTTGFVDGVYKYQVQSRAAGHPAAQSVSMTKSVRVGTTCTAISAKFPGLVPNLIISPTANCGGLTPEFRYSYRLKGTKTWTVYKAYMNSSETFYPLDTTSFADGDYEIYVEAKGLAHAATEVGMIFTKTIVVP